MAVIEGRKLPSAEREHVFDVDLVVVGSGAGGGPFAAEAAEAGLSVVIMEEGGYFKTPDFTTNAIDMVKKLYRNAGSTMAMGKPNINYMEGRCVGGSTVINAGISWRTPERILKQWRWEFGIEGIDPEAMEPCFERVEQRVNVAPQSELTYGGDAWVFKEGCEALDYRWLPVHRNQKHCVGTNNCIFGCPTGAKQSVLVTYIPRALAAGATLLADCRATKIRHDGQRATGVDGVFIDGEGREVAKVRVQARHVVVSAGAVQTPVLLQRSKVPDPHKQIGRNLMFHPNSKVIGIFDRELEAWKGAVQGVQITEFMEEGLLFGTTFVPPALHAITLPFWGAEAQAMMQHLNRMVTGAVLVEDTDSRGRVKAGFGGDAAVTYQLGEHDFYRLKKGIAILSEIYFAAGAREVQLPFHRLSKLSSPDEITRIFDPTFKPNELEVLTVHAMSTARMGADPRRSVTDGWGRVHGFSNLHISDASLFPGPIGVNPQITIMAIATRNVGRLLQQEGLALAS